MQSRCRWATVAGGTGFPRVLGLLKLQVTHRELPQPSCDVVELRPALGHDFRRMRLQSALRRLRSFATNGARSIESVETICGYAQAETNGGRSIRSP
jgi:hypothetical protein